MEVSGQLHTPASWPPGKQPPVSIGYEAGFALVLVWWRVNLITPSKNRTQVEIWNIIETKGITKLDVSQCASSPSIIIVIK
jgi:hypothetical protein